MKIILTIEIPDAVAKREGVTYEELTKAAPELKGSLQQDLPDGTIFTVTTEP